MDRFEWLPTESADERYPMQLISGRLHCGDEFVPVPAGKIVTNGWGEVGSRRLVGAPQKPVPERASLAWFSYTEDRFFAGELELPRDELRELFEAGYREPSTGRIVSWSKIIVGMGLGGWTSVWLAGGGLVREVARAQLEPRELAWAQVVDNPDIARADFVGAKLRSRLTSAQLKLLAEHGPPVADWPRYAGRYRWRLLVEGLKVPLHMYLRSFNGERAYYDFARQPPQELVHAPKRMQITWRTRSGRNILTKIELDEREVFEAFDELCTRSEEPVAQLRVDLGPRSRVAISLEADERRIALKRSSVELLSLA